jgi:putative transcriptional regulator
MESGGTFGDMDLKVERGMLLAAGPDLLDPNFMHGVVLMCQHTDEGAYGLIVNRPSELTTHQVLEGHMAFTGTTVPDFPVFIGGPVGLDTLQIVHRVPERVQGGVEIANGFHIGGDLDSVARYLIEDREHAARNLRVTLGYSGWGEGQLEVELATGSWLPAPGDASIVFRENVGSLWRDVVRSIGNQTEGLAEQPPDPEWN